MPEFFIDGVAVQARDGQTVLEAALENGHYIPHLCWHKSLSVAGNCRVCVVQVEGRSWTEIACNLPVTPGLRIETGSELVREQRKATMQFITLNHPVDCGICDKAGECTLQDYHYAYNGSGSISIEQKVRNTKLHELSSRILLDNERCVVCTRCVRFTHEVSGSNALGVLARGDESTIRASADGAFEHDHYSDNVIDICPVGALLSRDFLHKVRVWYLQATPSVCPGCERGCSVDLWHRKPEWHVRSLDAAQNTAIARVTPRDDAAVNGPWICNKGRDIARILERTRATGPMLKGRAVAQAEAVAEAARLIAAARRPLALVSSWASNEELAAFAALLGPRFRVAVKADMQPAPGEPLADTLLIRADKNPNTAGARAVFGAADAVADADTDLVLVWGEGCDFTQLPRAAKTLYLNAWLDHANGWADVFFATSLQTERDGHYTNFEGHVGAFRACFPRAAGAVDAAALFAAIAAELPA